MTQKKLLAVWRARRRILELNAKEVNGSARSWCEAKAIALNDCIKELDGCIKEAVVRAVPTRVVQPALVGATLKKIGEVVSRHALRRANTPLAFNRVSGTVSYHTRGSLRLEPLAFYREVTLGEQRDAANAIEADIITKIPPELHEWRFRFVDGYRLEIEAISPCQVC